MDGIKRGHIFYVEKSVVAQAAGSEQMPGRPAVIVSNDECNRSSNVVEVVYLTTQPKKDLPTHVAIRSSGKPAVALCEQVSSVSVDRLRDRTAKCTDREMQMIDIALAISLGIDPEPQVVEKVIEKPVTVETSAPLFLRTISPLFDSKRSGICTKNCMSRRLSACSQRADREVCVI